MEFNAQRFSETPQVVDGNQYTDCTFDQCRIIYRGGDVPSMNACSFNNCSWHFEEGAERTLLFMKLLYHGMGTNGPALVESAISQIREPMP